MNTNTSLLVVAALGVTGLTATASAQAVKVDASVPAYQRASGVSGTLNSVGSDTMNNLMTLWGEAFAKMYPNVRIQVEGKGSSTAPPALIAGTSQFGPMSRASGIGYRTSGVKVLSVAAKEGTYSDGNYADVVSGRYPLARFLYLYVNKAPNKPLDPVVREFLKLVFSREGQEIVLKDGYLPLTAAIATEERAKVE
jgi:ABC-type phosphate transport system substrate-binding protein